ncbi:uncharacterized protein Pyn_22176 [Prunus yedoensis var. nudiflora]|uniref:S-protein homolog n=1 Tax=Prunus yedoensis var. nudiflora TaxID=2094558 RepID=A0A314XMI1_PRUYE|nr:uncharacterized protein Pyn_22176 [Prunus yedoensis var. nudiflora]
MRAFKGYVVFFVCVAILALSAPCLGNSLENTVGIRFDRWHVHVVNNLSAGKTLFAHCKSKDDDLGERNLAPGTEFNWSFKEHFFGSTLYWCYMSTGQKHAALDVFWVESDHSWLQYRCNWKDCIWIAKDDGIYIKIIPENRDEFSHKWEV